MLTIASRTDTPAFDGPTGAATEAARVLREIASWLEHPEGLHSYGGLVDPASGAHIGAWSLADHRR